MADPTPGPWVAYEAVRRGYTIHGSGDSETIIGCADEEGRYGNVTLKENARLIAASPDLLEALQDMLSGWKYIRETHGDLYGVGWDRAQEKAEAAIVKATGETK